LILLISPIAQELLGTPSLVSFFCGKSGVWLLFQGKHRSPRRISLPLFSPSRADSGCDFLVRTVPHSFSSGRFCCVLPSLKCCFRLARGPVDSLHARSAEACRRFSVLAGFLDQERVTQLRSIFLFESCSACLGAVQVLDFSVVRQINFPPTESTCTEDLRTSFDVL
jgi:hypothetical protein